MPTKSGKSISSSLSEPSPRNTPSGHSGRGLLTLHNWGWGLPLSAGNPFEALRPEGGTALPPAPPEPPTPRTFFGEGGAWPLSPLLYFHRSSPSDHSSSPPTPPFPPASWKEYYQWRGLPLGAPLAVLLTYPLTAYYIITQLAPQHCEWGSLSSREGERGPWGQGPKPGYPCRNLGWPRVQDSGPPAVAWPKGEDGCFCCLRGGRGRG